MTNGVRGMDEVTKRRVLSRLRRYVAEGGILSLELSDFLETDGATELTASCEARQIARVRADWTRKHNKAKGKSAKPVPKTHKRKAPKPGRRRKPSHNFYRSREWVELRYAVLERSLGRCECCGVSTKEHGAKLNVDHIEAISKAWHKRLDPANLQVLCAQCNRGKSNRFSTDWRAGSVDDGQLQSEELSMLDARFAHVMMTLH